MILYTATLRCNGCDAEFDAPAVMRDEFREVAARVDLRESALTGGWALIDGGDWCPGCAPLAEAAAAKARQEKEARVSRRRAARAKAKGGAR